MQALRRVLAGVIILACLGHAAALYAGCSEQSLDEAMEKAKGAGGGVIEIDCGEQGGTIQITKTKHIDSAGTYTIAAKPGAGPVVLDAKGMVRHFMLGDTEHNKGLRADGYQLTLRNMAVRNGFANAVTTKKGTVKGGGCVYVGTLGKIYLEGMEFSQCRAGNVAAGSGTSAFTGRQGADNAVGSGTNPVFVGGAIAVNTQQMGGAVDNGGFLSVSRSVFKDNSAAAAGGAIYCGKCELEVVESKFERNKETNVPGLDGNGGALFLFVPARASIKKSEFVSNEAQGDGGAISIKRADKGTGVFVEECLFKDNTAWGNKADLSLFPNAGSKHGKGYCWCGGGAIHSALNTKLTIKLSSFTGNTGKQGGAIRAVHTHLIVEGSIFSNNHAKQWGTEFEAKDQLKGWDLGGNGGAVLMDGSHGGTLYARSTFEKNTADYRGAGINTFLFQGEEVKIEDSRFCGNEVLDSSLAGAAVNIGGDGDASIKGSEFGGNVVKGLDGKKPYAQSIGWCTENSCAGVTGSTVPGFHNLPSPGSVCTLKCPYDSDTAQSFDTVSRGPCEPGYYLTSTVGPGAAPSPSDTAAAPSPATTPGASNSNTSEGEGGKKDKKKKKKKDKKKKKKDKKKKKVKENSSQEISLPSASSVSMPVAMAQVGLVHSTVPALLDSKSQAAAFIVLNVIVLVGVASYTRARRRRLGEFPQASHSFVASTRPCYYGAC